MGLTKEEAAKILDVNIDDDADAIKKKYRKLALKLQPFSGEVVTLDDEHARTVMRVLPCRDGRITSCSLGVQLGAQLELSPLRVDGTLVELGRLRRIDRRRALLRLLARLTLGRARRLRLGR